VRRRDSSQQLSPGQYLTDNFPGLSAGPTPRIPLETWQFTVTTELGQDASVELGGADRPAAESITTDIHCVTRWSKLDTAWRGISLDTLLADVETEADYAMAHSYGGYSTNLPLEDLLDGKAWVAFEYDGEQLVPEHGGPTRLLVRHLYFWKSAKWVRGIELMLHDSPGFWEQLGYHDYGDPWSEQRYQGD
jgi:DMSO/TMAO reductase YedYZ molybdopterin-dependent catalytic subunit